MTAHVAEEIKSKGAGLALAAAFLGWMFDGLEMGLFPLVARPALKELLSTSSEEEVSQWFAIITAVFLIGAAAGGVFFGWLGDRIGRVRAMTLSVVTYALFSGACGLATAAWQVAVFRFIAALGMGGEWSLGVALVMEMWPNRSRAWLAGLIGAAANLGYMLIAVVALGLNNLLKEAGWRPLMYCGAIPALLSLFIQWFVPESHRWQEEKSRGSTSHWQTRDLLGVLIGTLAALGLIALWKVDIDLTLRIVGSLVALVILALGYLFPIFRYLGRVSQASVRTAGAMTSGTILGRMMMAAGLSGVALLGTWGTTQWAPIWADKLTDGKVPDAKAWTQFWTAFGAVIGCVLAALAGDRFGRRITYFGMCIASLLAVVGFYRLNTGYDAVFLLSGFLVGLITAAFYGWLPLYLPELFPTRVRATGQGFGFNFGRVLAAIGVLQLPLIMREMKVGYAEACPVMALVYFVGMILIWFVPETKNRPLPV